MSAPVAPTSNPPAPRIAVASCDRTMILLEFRSKPKLPLSCRLSPSLMSSAPEMLKPPLARSMSKGRSSSRPPTKGSSGSFSPSSPRSSPGSFSLGSSNTSCGRLRSPQSMPVIAPVRPPAPLSQLFRLDRLTSGHCGSSVPKFKSTPSPAKFRRGSANTSSGNVRLGQSSFTSGNRPPRSPSFLPVSVPQSVGSVMLRPGRFRPLSCETRSGSIRLGQSMPEPRPLLAPASVLSLKSGQLMPLAFKSPDRFRSMPGRFSRGSVNTSSGSVSESQSIAASAAALPPLRPAK